jgi:hypothetical protein
MKSYQKLLTAFFAVCFMAVAAFAADASPAGTWKWTQQGRGGGPGQEQTLVLEMKDGKLTGTLKGTSNGQFEIPDTAISNASVKDGMVAFEVAREFNGNKFVTKYSGKLEGDTITGSTERPGRGEGAAPQKADWVAKRSK